MSQVFAKALGMTGMQKQPEIVIMSTATTQDGRINYLLSVFNEVYPGKWTYWGGLSHWFVCNELITDTNCRAGELQVAISGKQRNDIAPGGFDMITTVLVKDKGMTAQQIDLDFSTHEGMKEIVHRAIYSAIERKVESQQ